MNKDDDVLMSKS